MKIEFDAIEAGAKVFVNLGHMTAKFGVVVGHRIICIGEKPQIEYCVRWFGDGDRGAKEEFFPSNDVDGSAHGALRIAFAPEEN